MDRPADVPEGYAAAQRDAAGRIQRRSRHHGYVGDVLVDTAVATGRWEEDPKSVCARVSDGRPPAGTRHHSHVAVLEDAVRRARERHARLVRAAISGWVLDPESQGDVSKSKGNVVTPMGLLEEHGWDGVRYWAASGRPCTDTAFDTGLRKVGRRLAIG